MVLYCVIGTMGSGKTLFATSFAYLYSKLNPNNKIYSNYELKLYNTIYNPYCIFPFSQLESCLIIVDDISRIANKGLLQIATNISRKKKIEMILTCQYYTMVPKSLRVLSKEVITRYNKNKNRLEFAIITDKNTAFETINVYKFNNVDKIFNLYNTNEIVDIQLDSKIKEEILKISQNKEDIEINCNMVYSNKTERKKTITDLLTIFESEQL